MYKSQISKFSLIKKKIPHTNADTKHSSIPTSTFQEMKDRLSSLERRLRAVEQPGKSLAISTGGHAGGERKRIHALAVWQISSREEDWEVCVEGPCKCIPEVKSVSCWRYDLLDLPRTQLIPADVLRLWAIKKKNSYLFLLFIH